MRKSTRHSTRPRISPYYLKRLSSWLVLSTALALTAAQEAKASTIFWSGTNTDALWSTPADWTGGVVPGAADTAVFNSASGPGGAVITTGAISLTGLTFDTAAAAAYTIGGATAHTGAITLSDASAAITMNNTVVNNELINADLTLGTAITSTTTISNSSATGTLTIAGNITGGTGGTAGSKTLAITGVGNTILSGAVTKGGAANLILQDNSTGTLTVNNANSLFTQIFFNGGGATSVLDIGSGTLKANNAGGATIQTQGTTSATINASAGGSIALQVSDGDWGAANGTTLTINAPITGAFEFENFVATNGTGITVLGNANNSFSGGLLISSSVVSVAGVGLTGFNSYTGTGSTIKLGGGTLRYTGTGEMTNKILNFSSLTNGIAIDMSGTGTLEFTNTAALAAGAGSKTLTLQGSTAGIGRIDGIIADNSGTNKTSVTKSGTGTWVLGGVNTYTGTTTVSAGRLILTQGQTLAGNVTVSAAAGFSYAASASAALNLSGTLAITGGSTTIGTSIGTAATSAMISVTGAATISNASHSINIYGVPGVTHFAGLTTLISGGAGSSLNPATAPTLGVVYNNTDFTVGAFTRSATALQVTTSAATALTSAFWTGGLAGSTNVWAASNGTTASNWAATSGGAVQALVPGAGADVTISSSSVTTAPTATVLGASMGIKTLTIADTTNGLGLNNDGFTLTITPAASTAGITMNASVPASAVGPNLVLGAAQTWTNNSANMLSISGGVSGAFAVTKAGTGPLTLSGNNTFTGGLTVSAGSTLNINSATALGTGTLALNAAGITLDNTFGQAITMTANNPVTLAAAATSLTFAGTNGANSNLNLGTGAVTLGAGTTFTVTNAAATLTSGGTVALGANAHTKTGAGTLALNGVISGSKTAATTALTVSNGTLAIGGVANTFTGDILVDGASSVFQMTGNTFTTVSPYGTAGGIYKTLTLQNGGIFRVTSGIFNDNQPSATNVGAGIIFNIGTGGGVLDVASGATLTIDDGTGTGTATTASQIQGSGNITKTGLGILQQDDSTAYAGTITVTAGTLQPATANAFGASSAGTTIQSGAQLNVNGITMTNAEPVTISGTGLASNPQGALTNNSGTSATWVGPITLSGSATIGLSAAGALTLSSGATINIGANTLTFANNGTGNLSPTGVISGTGPVVVTGTGQYVPNAQSTYSGGTTLSAGTSTIPQANSTGNPGSVTSGPFGTGTITAFASSQIRATTGSATTINNNVTLNGGITFLTAGTEKNFTFGGPVTLSGGNAVLTSTVGNTVAGTLAIISGAIGDGGNNYSVTKTGTGNLILSGANTYTGGTIVNAGLLNLTGSVASNTALTVAGGGTFSLFNNAANPLTTVSALSLGTAVQTATLTFDMGANTAASDRLVSANAATTAGTVAFNLNAMPGFGTSSSYTLVSALSGLSGATYTLGNVAGGYTYSFASSTDSAVILSLTPAASGNVYWRGAVNNGWGGASGGNTNWTTDAAGLTNAGFSPGAFNTVIFSASNAAGPTITTTLDGNFTINDLQFVSAPTGVSSVAITNGLFGTNTLTVAPASSAVGISLAQGAGAVTISAPLVIGAPQTWTVDSSTPGSGTASSLTVSSPITGSGANGITFTTSAGTAPILLSSASGTSTYGGPSAVSIGTIVQGGATNAFSANTAWTVNGTLNTGAFSQVTGSLAGGAGTVQNGSGTSATLTIGSDNLGTGGSPATFPGTLQNGSTASLAITKAGTGVQALTGTYSYTGATTVNAGTLRLAGNSTGTTTVTVNNAGSVLQFGSATALSSSNTVSITTGTTLDLFGNSVTINSLTNVAGATITNTSTSVGASTATTVGSPALTDALTISAAGVNVGALITDGPTRKTQIIVNNVLNGGYITTNTANTFSGGVVLANNAGGTRMNINTTMSGTPWGTGPIIIGQTATDKAGIFLSANNIIPNPIIFNTNLGNDRFGVRSDVSGGGFSGVITANVDAVFSSNTTTGSFALTNQITGVGGLVLDASQTGTANTVLNVTLNNATINPNNYQGDTVVGRTNATPTQNYAANLILGAANQIPNGVTAGNVLVNTSAAGRTGTLNLNGFSETINGLNGNGGVTATGSTLTLGDNNATASFSGAITGGTITKIGSGTQTLSGANTFTTLNANAGLVAFATSPISSGPLGNTTAINLNGGGISYTATGSNDLNRPLAIGAGNGTVNVSSSTGTLTILSGVTSSGGNLIKTGPGELSLPGATTLNGGAAGVTVSGGTLQAGFGTNGVSTVTVGAAGNLNLSNLATEALTLGNGAGALTLNGGAQLGFELDGGNNDSIAVGASGTAVTAGTVTLNFFNVFGGVSATTYNLLTAPSGLSGAIYQLGTAPNGFNYTINVTDTLVSVTTNAYTPIYWRGGQDFSWNTLGAGPANWTTDFAGTADSAHKPLSSETVIFSAQGTPFTSGTQVTTTLDAAFTVDSLQFDEQPAGVTAVTISAGSGGTLTLTPASTSGGIKILTLSGLTSATIAAPLTVGAAQTWDVADNTSTLIVSGATAFNANVTKTGAGTVTLSGTNSGSGTFTLSGGTLNINSATALGSGTFRIGAGTTIDSTVGGGTVVSTANLQNWNGDFTYTGTNSLNLGTGAVTLGSSLTVTTSAGALTVGGAIGGASAITKAGSGTLVLAGNNTYSGLTTMNAGVLTLSGNNTTVGGVTLNAGILNVNNAGALGSGTLTINGGTLDNTNGGVTSNAVPTTVAASFGFTGTNNLNLGTGAIALTTTPTITTASSTLTLGGGISGVSGITKAGAGTLTLSGANTYSGVTTVSAGTLNLSGSLTNLFLGNIVVNGGSTLNITGSVTGSATSTALRYGDSTGNTIVNLSGSYNGFITTGANVAGSVAVLNQTAGSITIVPTNSADTQYLANNGGYGMLNITGGTFNTGRFDGVGGSGTAASAAVMYVGGTGTLNQNVGDWFLPIRTNGLMSMTIGPGGSFVRSSAVTSQFSIIGLNGTNSYGIFNVAGGTVDTGTKGINISQSSFSPGTGNVGFVNAAGGTLLLGLNTGVGAAAGSTNAYFNFAGATVKATAAMTAVIPASTANYTITSTIFGPITNNNNADTAFNTQVGTSSNFTGGLVVDTNNFNVTFTNALVGADGKFGVTQANITIPSIGNSGYIGAPMVQFAAPSGGGVPATGYALISGGQVTGIVITNPGTYASGETPAITFTGGGGSIASFNTSALTAANASAGLTKNSAGTLALSGASTYTGQTVINAGTLQLGAAGTTGTLSTSSAISVANNAIFQINRTNAVVQGTDFTSTPISGQGSVVVTGAAAATVVTLNAANTYQGGTTLISTQGTAAGPILVVSNSQALGTGTLTLRSSGFGGADTFQLNGTGLNIANPITMDTTLGFREGIDNVAASGANTLSGNITISGTTAQALILANNSTTGAFTVSGNITATGGNTSNLSLRGAGTTGVGTLSGVVTLNSFLDSNVGGIWTISSSGNTWTQTQFNATVAGTGLKLGANDALCTSADVLWGATAIGTLNLNGFNQTVAGIAATLATPIITNGGAADSILTISNIGTSPKNFTGVIQDGATNKISLVLNSAGKTQILTGTNTYTGTTTISNGTLQLGNAGATGTLSPTSNIVDNGSFVISRTGTVTQGVDFGTISTTGTGSFAQASTGTTILTATNTYNNGTTISAGTLQVGNGGAGGTLGTGPVTNSGTLIFNRTTNYTLDATSLITGAGVVTLANSGTVAAAADGQFNTTGVLNIGTGVASTTGVSLDLTNGSATFGSMVANVNSASNTITLGATKTLTVNGAITVASSTSAPDITTNLVISGGAFVDNLGAGAIVIGQHNTGGTTQTGNGLFGTLDLSGTTSVQINGTAGSTISLGASTTTVNGVVPADTTQGTLKLSATGSNTVSATTITLGNSPNIGGAGIQGFIVLGNAANNFQADTIYVGRQKSAAGALPAAAADSISFAGSGGTWTLGGLAGAKTTLNIGYNDAGGTGTITTGIVDLTGGSFNGTLGTVSVGFYNTTGGSGGGIGTLTIAGGSTTADAIILATTGGSTTAANNSGTLNLNGGSLTLAAAGAGITKGTGTLNGTANVTLAGTNLNMNGTNIGSAAKTVTFAAQSGTLQNLNELNGGALLTKTTAGTLTMSGVNSYTGGTTVSGGTMILSGANTGTGVIRGVVNVSVGATLQLASTNALGYNVGVKVTTINVNGGLVDDVATGDQGFNQVYNLTGATLQSNGGVSSPTATQWYAMGSGSAVNTLASATTSTISGRVNFRGDIPGNNVVFTVADGGAATDLLVSSAITESGGNPVVLTKTGNGLMKLTGINSYTGGTTVNAGTLNVNADAALGAAAGAVAISGNAVLQADAAVTVGPRTVTVAIGGATIDTNGNTVTLGAGSTVTDLGAGNTLRKIGAGTLNLNGTQAYGTLTTSAGTTNVNTALGTGSSTVNANATTNIGASQTLAALNIGAGAVVTFGDGPFAFGFGDAPELAVGGSDAGLSGSAAVVPEPGSMGLLLLGGLSLALRRRREGRAGA